MPYCTSRIGLGMLAIFSGGVMTQTVLATGPDVVLSGSTAVWHHTNTGAVDGKRAYSFESQTCNMGDVNLNWGLPQGGKSSPGLGQNMYRFSDGRLVQIGQSWVKYADSAFAGAGCGTCNGVQFSQLGVGCMDTYSALYNGSRINLGPRSGINAFTGEFSAIPPGNFDTPLDRRIVVAQSDLSVSGAKFFIEGVYVSTDDAAAGNAMNNASYRRITVQTTDYNATMADVMHVGEPAITAWPAFDDLNAVTETGTAYVPGEGRFHYLYRVLDLGNGSWRYDYAVFNLNSDASGGSFSVPLPNDGMPTNIGFHDVDYHSGEPYDNTDWTVSVSAGAITWSSPQTYAENPNSNALRWGTMYNFWFDLDVPPTASASGCVTLGLFKPFDPGAIQMAAIVPQSGETCPPLPVACPADFNGVNGVTVQDIFDFLTAWLAGNTSADFNHVNGVTVQDIFDFLTAWLAGC